MPYKDKEKRKQYNLEYNLKKVEARKEYYENRGGKEQAKIWYENNKEKRKEQRKIWYEANKEILKEKQEFKRYKLTKKEKIYLLNIQNEECAICPEKLTLDSCQIDHYDLNNEPIVRGLLCLNCNTALGKFKDNPEIIEKAKNYLIKKGYNKC